MSNEFKIKKGLVVEGDARVTGAILDSTNAPGTSGQVLTSTVTGTDWKSLAEISGVDGTGTANYLSKWSDADTITNSIVYDNGTNVGIGTTSPTTRLHVFSSGIIQRLESSNSYTQLDFYNTTNTAANRNWAIGTNLYSYGDFNIMASAAYNTAPNASYTYLTIKNSGNVGIGTTSPGAKLHVSGGGQYISASASATAFLRLYSNAQTSSQFEIGQGFATATDNIAYLWNVANASMAFGTNSTERMRITSAGNVGIGTTSPAQKLSLAVGGNLSFQNTLGGTGTYGAIFSYNDLVNTTTPATAIKFVRDVAAIGPDGAILFDTNNTERMRITSAGNVGIGTTAPGAKLEVEAATAGYASIIKNTTAGGDYLKMIGDSGNTVFEFGSGGTGGEGFINIYSDAVQKVLINADGTSYFNGGNVGIGTTSPVVNFQVNGTSEVTQAFSVAGTRYLQIYTDGAIATINGLNSAPLVFSTSTGTSFAERMRITSAGNVGIGTTAPGTKLQVAGTIRATGTTGIVDVDPLYGAFRFYNGSTFYGGFYNDAVLSAGNAVDLVSYVATGDYYIGSATTAKAVKVEQGGNVGIGTTSPTTKLDVNGVVNATSFSAGGTAGFTGTVVFASNPPGSQMLDFQGGLLVSVS